MARRRGKLLEVGCGWGEAAEFARRRGWEVTAVDASAECIAECRRRYPELDTRVMRAEQLEFPDNCFDHVESSHLLEHVEDFGAALGEMARVLKPGGTLIAEVPAPALEAQLLSLDPQYHAKAGHRRVVTRELMELAAREAGLKFTGYAPVDGVLRLWVVAQYRRGRFIESDVGEIPGSSEAMLKLLRYFSSKVFRHRKLRLLPLWLLGIPLGWLISRFVPLAHRYRMVKPRS